MLSEICFMGDDVNDLAAMEIAGFSAAPANARPAVLDACRLHRHCNGGDGAVRELVDAYSRTRQRTRVTKLSDYVIRFVAGQGVKHVFLVTGGGAMHLNDSLARCRDIEPVCNSHEQASAIGAENYAKVTDNLGVALVTTGPGGTNTVTGVAGAWLDSTPCLFISGQVKRPDRMFDIDGTPLGMRQLGVQEVDIVSIVKPITKYAVTVLDPNDIRYHLEKAVHLARTGRPGPVWIDIPLDVQAAPIDENKLQGFDPHDLTAELGESDLRDKVRDVIERAEPLRAPAAVRWQRHPAGRRGGPVPGTARTAAHARRRYLVRLRSDRRATTRSSWDGPARSPRAARTSLSRTAISCSLSACGSTSPSPVMRPTSSRARRTNVVVDIDPAELEKLAPHVQMPICCRRRRLHPRVAAPARGHRDHRSPCVGRALRRLEDPLPARHRRAPQARYPGQHLQPRGGDLAGDDAGRPDGLRQFRHRRSRSSCWPPPRAPASASTHCAALGSMGFALPGSIAVCVGGGRRRTIVVDGDGGFQFNIQELETVARLNLPIKFFVLNNDGYASIRASQSAWFGKASIGCDRETGLTVPDLGKMAESYGIKPS